MMQLQQYMEKAMTIKVQRIRFWSIENPSNTEYHLKKNGQVLILQKPLKKEVEVSFCDMWKNLFYHQLGGAGGGVSKQIYLSQNRYICIIDEQLCNTPLSPLNKGTETKYEVIMWKPKWIYRRALINKQENWYKNKRRRRRYRDASLSSSPREDMLVWSPSTKCWFRLKRGVGPRRNTVNYVVCEDLPLFICY